jgi:tol-pal system protein YbgF
MKKFAGASLVIIALMMTGSAVQAQSSDSSAAAAAEIRFQQLEKEVRRLTGQVEEQNYQIRSLKEELARQTGDMQVRIEDVEKRSGIAPPPSGDGTTQTPNAVPGQEGMPSPYPPPYDAAIDAPSSADTPSSSFEYTPPNAAPPAAQPQGGTLGTLNQSPDSGEYKPASGESAEYEAAYEFIKSRDFERAESSFEAFIAKYPGSSYMPNAKYWYGETFYVRGNYEKAARIFAESYQADPKGPKAAANLLKLGMSLGDLGKKDDACIALKQLQKDYASSAVPILKRAETEMKRLGCQ